jgi:hypothetical protein
MILHHEVTAHDPLRRLMTSIALDDLIACDGVIIRNVSRERLKGFSLNLVQMLCH